MCSKEAVVSLREITAETVRSIVALEVAEAQKNLVAPNAVSISEAYFSEHAWIRAIYAGDTPVGFVMLYLDQEKPEYDIWRFMVDARYQGRGYAFQAMHLVIDHVRRLPNATEIYLSYVPKDGNAGPFYRKCGFVDTGEVAEGENVMRLDLEPAADSTQGVRLGGGA
jgi:diamine N-acetyltransferase